MIRRTFCRFTLLLWFVAGLIVTGVWLRRWKELHSPLVWLDFERAHVRYLLDHDRHTIIVAVFHWTDSPKQRAYPLSIFNDSSIRRLLADRSVILMAGGYDWPPVPLPDVQKAMLQLDLSSQSLPAVVVYSASCPDGRIVLENIGLGDVRLNLRLQQVLNDLAGVS